MERIVNVKNPSQPELLHTAWQRLTRINLPFTMTLNFLWESWLAHGETKATCLWLKNLPKLTPTNIVNGREARVHKATPRPDRWKERSRTLQGVANAMASQWGKL